MKLRNLTLTVLGILAIAAMSMFSIGCSGSDNPTGPGTSPAGQTYDEITVSLNRLSVKYDCDFNPVGVTNPGDFRYSLNVDTLSDDGTTWIRATSNKEKSSDISNGGYKNITNQKGSFRFPRRNGQSFRVVMTLREADPSSNDFSTSNRVTHSYASASAQMYAPEGTNYSSWSNSTKVGSMSWNVNKRSRSWVAGILTKEGCNATMAYTVTVREVQ